MTSKFLSRNGEIYRVLLENTDTFWLISFDNPIVSANDKMKENAEEKM